MRLVLVASTLAALSAPAFACPPLEACLTQLPSTTKLDSETKVKVQIEAPVTTRPKLAPGEVEMPWIWSALRQQVYSRMPTYEERNELKIVLSPVVVTSLDDTIPGVGVSGLWF